MMPRYRFGPDDRVTIGGIDHRWVETLPGGHVFARLDAPGVHATVTDAEIAARAARRDYACERGGLSATSARVRAIAGPDDLHDYPVKTLSEVLHRHRWCSAFLAEERAGKATRSAAGMASAIARLAGPIREEELKGALAGSGGRPGRRGTDVGIRVFGPPSVSTLRRWLARFEAGAGAVQALRPGNFRSGGRAPRYDPELDAMIQEHAARYASEERRTIAKCHEGLRAAVDAENAIRQQEDLPPFPTPSYKAVAARIKALPAFEICAARFGIERAKRMFAILGDGLDVTRAGQRIEMDEWEEQLQRVLVTAGVWATLDRRARRALKRVRVHVCVALDAASRCVVGLAISVTPSARNALDCLEMVLRDRGAYAAAVGATSGWLEPFTPESIVTDAGSTFRAYKFLAAVAAACASPHTAPAGQPQLRGRIERFNATLHAGVASCFTGRTFANVVEKGDYDAEGRASAFVEDLLVDLPRWVLDVYHNRPHAGLGGETPLNAWKRLVREFGVLPPQGGEVLRNVFGLEVTRPTGRHGVRILGLDYRSNALQEHRRRHGDREVKVRVDRFDLGSASAWLGDGWYPLACARPGFDGVSVEAWIEAADDLRRRHAADAVVAEPVMLAAVRALERAGKRYVERSGLGGTRPDRRAVERAERDLFIGLRLADAAQPAAGPDSAAGLLDGAVEGSGPLSPSWLGDRGIPAPPVPEVRDAEAGTPPDADGGQGEDAWGYEDD